MSVFPGDRFSLGRWAWIGPALIAACGEAAIASSDGQAPAKNEKPAIAASQNLKLRRIEVADPGIGCTAFTMLIPAEWTIQGGVLWQMQYSNLATGQFVVRDPKSAAALESFPIIPACWDDSGSVGFFQTGQNYMGSVVYPPPRDVLGYVRDVFVPLHRKSVQGLKIGAATELPEVSRAVQKGVQEAGVEKRVSAGKVRLEYVDRGKAVAEDVYITIVLSRSPLVPTMTIWSLEHQYSFRAEKDRIDTLAPLLQAMISSLRLELAWYAGYAQVLDLWRQGQMQSIRDAGELSRRISRNNDEILAGMRSSWEERQASQDRTSREFSEYVRGVETYDHPYEGREVQLPSGYRDVWTNRSGEYVFSNEAGFDPNVGSTLAWTRLEAAR
ncbi:MAG: hypothetical protein ACKVXR_08215 [Planctomycetota bacterium]